MEKTLQSIEELENKRGHELSSEELGIEVAVLDCLGFINHFLHFFHRYKTDFLDHYQELLLKEPNSAVSQPLKDVFLSLRKVAEST